MKAEFSDAPERITRRGKKHGVRSLVACLAVGSAVVVSAFLLVSRSGADKDTLAVEAKNQAPNGELSSGSIMRNGGASAITSADPPARQTSFNDQNFAPSGAHNIVSFHRTPKVTFQEATPELNLTIVRQTPSMKDRACWPLRQGSVESRNCRLAVGLKHRD